MITFILRRTCLALVVVLTVMTLAFVLTRLSGDLAISIAGPGSTQADVEVIRKAYGLDRPVLVQFYDWTRLALTGDFGSSFFFKDKVATLIAQRMPVTLSLGFVGLALALSISLPLGILAALYENTWIDRTATMLAMIGQAMPSFWLGLLLMIVFGLQLGWLPISGTGSWEHYVMPGIVLAFTVQLGFMLGGSIVIETVFALHGVGYLAWESISKNDFPVVQAVVLVLASLYIGLTLVSDILNALLDPRLRGA